MTNRPRRQSKSDRLIYPGASASDIRCDYAVAPFDRAAREMESKWGIDRLPELVGPETAEKFGSAMAKLNAAIEANDPAETAARAGVCIRGLAALDAEAIQRGHRPIPATVWLHEYEGETYAMIQDGATWTTVADQYPGLRLRSMREVAVALAAYDRAVVAAAEVLERFPGATILKSAPRQEEMDDPISF